MFVYLEEEKRGVSLSFGPCIDEGVVFFFFLHCGTHVVQDFFFTVTGGLGAMVFVAQRGKETQNQTKDKAFA